MYTRGTTLEGATIKLYLKIPNITLGFECVQDSEDKQTWNVTIPELDHIITSGTYDFCLCLYIDNYCFTPVEGSVRILNDQPDVSISSPDDIESLQTVDSSDDNQADDSIEDQPVGDEQQELETDMDDMDFSIYPNVLDKVGDHEGEIELEETTKRNESHTFFKHGTPKQLAEQIKSSSFGVRSEKDDVVKKILSEYKKD